MIFYDRVWKAKRAVAGGIAGTTGIGVQGKAHLGRGGSVFWALLNNDVSSNMTYCISIIYVCTYIYIYVYIW